MKRAFVAALAAASLFVTVGGMSAHADQSELSTFLFGRNYNDGVIAVYASPGHWDDDRDPSYFYSFPARIRDAQAAVAGDPLLLDALARRHILVQNVLRVDTAANGGRIIYYR